MTLSHNQENLLSITALLIWTLACRAATRWIIPDTPTSPPIATVTPAPTHTLTPTFTPTSTPTTAVYEARCPLVVSQILRDAIPSDNVIHS